MGPIEGASTTASIAKATLARRPSASISTGCLPAEAAAASGRGRRFHLGNSLHHAPRDGTRRCCASGRASTSAEPPMATLAGRRHETGNGPWRGAFVRSSSHGRPMASAHERWRPRLRWPCRTGTSTSASLRAGQRHGVPRRTELVATDSIRKHRGRETS